MELSSGLSYYAQFDPFWWFDNESTYYSNEEKREKVSV